MRFYTECQDGFRPATPAKIVCYDDGGGDWTIDVEDDAGRCLRDAWGNYPASAWVDYENGNAPMDERQAISVARGLRRQMEIPCLPIFVWRDRTATRVEEQAADYWSD